MNKWSKLDLAGTVLVALQDASYLIGQEVQAVADPELERHYNQVIHSVEAGLKAADKLCEELAKEVK